MALENGVLMRLEGVGKRYRGGAAEVQALLDVDLEVRRGESVAITGPSGSGKSTLLHILGLLDRPSTGSYAFEGRPVQGLTDGEISALRGRRIGFVFQAFNLLPDETALHNVMLPLVYARAPRGRERARAALERVGLGARAGHRPAELSGGERQRVAIARAIVKQPALILADEPTGNLDSVSGGQVLDIFDLLHREGLTLLIITHDLQVAARCARRLQMCDGRLEGEAAGGDRE